MTRDERIEAIRRDVKECEAHKIVKVQALDEVCFLLDELDAAEARAQRLTDAIKRLKPCPFGPDDPCGRCCRCVMEAFAGGEDTP